MNCRIYDWEQVIVKIIPGYSSPPNFQNSIATTDENRFVQIRYSPTKLQKSTCQFIMVTNSDRNCDLTTHIQTNNQPYQIITSMTIAQMHSGLQSLKSDKNKPDMEAKTVLHWKNLSF